MKKSDSKSAVKAGGITGKVLPEEILALLGALGFMQSVLTTFHHVRFNDVVESPEWWLAAFVLGVVSFVTYKRGGVFSKTAVVTLTVLAVSAVFWVSGLRANFG